MLTTIDLERTFDLKALGPRKKCNSVFNFTCNYKVSIISKCLTDMDFWICSINIEFLLIFFQEEMKQKPV